MEHNFIYFYLKDKDNNKLLPIGSFSDDHQSFKAFASKALCKKLTAFYLNDFVNIEKTISADFETYCAMKDVTNNNYIETLEELSFAKFLCQYFYKILYDYQWINETSDEKYIYVGIDCPNATAEDIIE